MVQRYQTHGIFLLICGFLVAISLLLVGAPDVQAQASNSCPEGQIWSLNRCTDVEETTCQSGYTYVADNGCVRIDKDVQTCPSGYEMTGGRCQLADEACPAGETWRDGSCQAREEQSCPAGQERVNGSCFQITETVCPVGYTWSDSNTRCVDNNGDSNGDSNSVRRGVRRGVRNGDGSNIGNVVSSILTLSDTNLTVDEGCNVTYTVALKSEPSDDVTVTIGDPANTDVTAEPATLTFTPDNWDEPQTVTVTCHEDDDAVDDEATVTHTVDGPGWDSVVDEDLDIHVIDNDTADLTISDSSFNVDEVCNETYTIQLDSKPTANVTVTIGDPSNTAVMAEPAALTFTPDNWDVPQTVTVTCAEDDNAVNEESTVTHTVGGGDYEGVTAPGVTFKVTDNDTAGVTLSETVLIVGEGGTDTYTVKLDTEPTGNVTVTINDPANTDVTAEPATLTFTPDNWDDPQTVTVTCHEDDDAVTEVGIASHTVSGADYGSVTAEDVTVSVADNDTRGVTISESPLTIVEGGTGTYTVQLDTEPTGNVTVTINDPTDNTDVTTDPATLTFTTLNWKNPQTVTVTAREDDDAGDDGATVTHSVSGAGYGSVTAEDVTVSVTESDTATLTISDTSFNVNEVCNETYTIQLDSKPTANVTVTINDPTDNTAVTAEPATLTFTPDNWDFPQTVTVTCAEDDNAVNEESIVTHTVGGGDYEGVSAPGVTVSVTDNDTPGVVISESPLTIDEGGTGTYTMKLNTEPTGNVTVTIHDPVDNTDVTTDPATLTFTTLNWKDPQTVTVTVQEDDDAGNDEATVTHSISGADYGSVTADNVTVSVTDNDTRGVTISESPLTIDEGGTGTYTVRLDTEPTGIVTVTINDPTDNTDVTTGPATLTFTTLNWKNPQTVTVTAREDDDAGDDGATVTHSVSGAGYGSVTADNVTVSVTDNDTRGVTISEPKVTVYESGTGTYAVQLDTEPTGNVTVTINDPTDNTDVTTDPATLTFTTLNWKNPQTVTVTAQDDDDESDDAATVTHSVSGADYGSATAANVTVSVTDTDKAGVFISPTTHAVVDECHYTYYSVKLLMEPTSEVTVTIGDPSNTDVTADPAALTFTPDNWEDEQDVTLTCTKDDDAAVDKAYVTHTVRGGGYDGFTVLDVAITVYDTDIAGVTISESSLAIGENGTGTYTVQLDTEPTGNVTVTINDPTDNTDVTTDPAALTFTTLNWETPQTVTITAAEDADAADDTATVTHSVSGGDYGSVTVDAVDVLIEDSHTVGIIIFPLSLTVVEGSTGTYTIKLATEPTDNVKVNYYGNHADVTLAPVFLTFTPQNWSIPQTVTVTAGEDPDAVTDAPAYITHNAFGGDYGGIYTDEVAFAITDDDTPGVTIAESSLTINEGGTGAYSVYLDTEPTGNVTVTINDPTDNTDVTTDPATLTFTTLNWERPQTVTVTAAEDDDAAEGTATVTHSVSGGDYGSVTVDDVKVTVTDT